MPAILRGTCGAPGMYRNRAHHIAPPCTTGPLHHTSPRDAKRKGYKVTGSRSKINQIVGAPVCNCPQLSDTLLPFVRGVRTVLLGRQMPGEATAA